MAKTLMESMASSARLIPARYTPETQHYFAAVHESIHAHKDELERCRFADMRSGKLDGSLTTRAMVEWQKLGLVPPAANDGDGWRLFSAFDVARIKTFAVARARGLSLSTLQVVKTALDTMLDRSLSLTLWEFAFFYMNRRYESAYVKGADMDKAGDLFLAVNGDNKCAIARAPDIPALIAEDNAPTADSPSTYSHMILNLSRILEHCDFIMKIDMNPASFMKSLGRRALEHFNDPAVEKLTIDKRSAKIEIEASAGADPKYGERIEKFQDGRKVHTRIKSTETLDE